MRKPVAPRVSRLLLFAHFRLAWHQACRPIPTYQVAHTAHRQEGRDLAGHRGRGWRSFADADRWASAAAAGRAGVQATPWRSLHGPGTSRGGTVPSRLQRPPRLLQAGLGRSWEPGERVVMARPAERRCSSRSNAPEAACHRALLGRARIEHVVARAVAHRRCWVDAMLTLLAVFGLIASGTLHFAPAPAPACAWHNNDSAFPPFCLPTF